MNVTAPAKLTLSLRVTGRRDDGYHLLDAEMVTIDLADTLIFGPGSGISVQDLVKGGLGARAVPFGAENLVARALDLVSRRAAVRIEKRIPPGAGLGGGSADAAAVLRWAGVADLTTAAHLGADVPFCVRGGRARVTGVGEKVEELPFEDRHFVLLLPQLSVDTATVYRRFDERRTETADRADIDDRGGNDLEAAALEVAPALGKWRDLFAHVTGQRPRLAGSGSSWFVERDKGDLGVGGDEFLEAGDERAHMVAVRTVPGDSDVQDNGVHIGSH